MRWRRDHRRRSTGREDERARRGMAVARDDGAGMSRLRGRWHLQEESDVCWPKVTEAMAANPAVGRGMAEAVEDAGARRLRVCEPRSDDLRRRAGGERVPDWLSWVCQRG